jgi:hypothetical protein
VSIGWILSIFIIIAVIFGPNKLMQFDYELNALEMALYGALNRPLWAISVAWIVFSCHLGYGGESNFIHPFYNILNNVVQRNKFFRKFLNFNFQDV